MANKIFITPDGKNRAVTFALVCTLFLLSALLHIYSDGHSGCCCREFLKSS